MSEVDKPENAVYHRIAQSDQGIDASDLYSVDQLLQELAHVFSSSCRHRGSDRDGAVPRYLTPLRIYCCQIGLLTVLDLKDVCCLDRVAVFVELVGPRDTGECSVLKGIANGRAVR